MINKALFMETTKVEAERTAAEISGLLVESGARRISTEYNESREVVGIHFELDVDLGADKRIWSVMLPARTEKLFQLINGRRKFDRSANAAKDRATAKRVAWRQLLRWTQAQLAMIDTGMAQAHEIFLPYVEVEPGVTFFQKVINNPGRMLAAANTVDEHTDSAIDAEFTSP
jgi:hypothetical protein